MYRIAVIYSIYPEIAEAAEELIRKKGYHVEVAVAVLDGAVQLAKKYEAEGFDLIISRGVTGSLIRNSVAIPVINVDITNFDILQTLYNARKYGKKMAFFQYSKTLKYHDFNFIREILGIGEEELGIYYFSSEEELKERVKEAFNSSVEVIVATGAYILEVAREQGFRTIMVRSTKEAIYNAFEQAEVILHTRDSRLEMYKYYSAAVEESSAGVIILDQEERVKYINPTASNNFRIEQAHARGCHYRELFRSIPALRGIDSGQDRSVVTINGLDFYLHKGALHHSGEIIGHIIKFEHLTPPPVTIKKKNLEYANKGMVARYTFADLIGKSDQLYRAIEKSKSYGQTDLTILVLGESGTGKEVLANAIHNVSSRRGGPFVAVNCATLPQSLLESELFGYEEGAFTGAKKGGRAGLFEIAQHGTIFLDEISEITLSSQAQLLRVLQEKVIRRVGGNRIIPVDVRIIAASNADLQSKIKAGLFREDLFFRLNVLNIRIPPLRERKEDIPLLINYFIKKHLGNDTTIKIPDSFMKKLKNYPWPGNVRELENFVEKFVILSKDNDAIYPLLEELFYDFSHYDTLTRESGDRQIVVELDTLKNMELQIIKAAYECYGTDKSSLARLLGISRSNLWSKLKEIGITEER